MGGGTGDLSQDLFGVHADILIPGRGDPIPHGGLIVSIADGIIVWVGAYSSLPSKYDNVTFTKYSGALMPGMCKLLRFKKDLTHTMCKTSADNILEKGTFIHTFSAPM